MELCETYTQTLRLQEMVTAENINKFLRCFQKSLKQGISIGARTIPPFLIRPCIMFANNKAISVTSTLTGINSALAHS